jgi:NADH:ubiquinone oxidoreductase subunit 5 (subunit L)/multisubunit Na+/H+ antiporter MnhA subunit
MQNLLIILSVLAIFPLALFAKKQPNNRYIKIGYMAVVLISMGYLSFDYLQNPKESSAFTWILLLVLVSTNKLFNPKASR